MVYTILTVLLAPSLSLRKQASASRSAAQYHSLADSLGRRGQLPQQQHKSNGVGAILPMSVLEQGPDGGMEQRQRTISASS